MAKKPNRKYKRYFKPCDVARIARNCRDDNNLTGEQVIACVAKGLGFSHISTRKGGEIDVVESNVSLNKGIIMLIMAVVRALVKDKAWREAIERLLSSDIPDIVDNQESPVDNWTGKECECKDFKQEGNK